MIIKNSVLNFFIRKFFFFLIENLFVLSKIVQNFRSVLKPSIFTQQHKISPNFPITKNKIWNTYVRTKHELKYKWQLPYNWKIQYTECKYS